MPMRVVRVLVGPWMALSLSSAAAAAQEQPSTLVTGVVIDADSRQPVAGARLELQGSYAAATTDSAGRFSFAGVPSGKAGISVRAIGFAPIDAEITVHADRVSRLRFEMERAAQPLERVVVEDSSQYTGTNGGRFDDFLRRIETGRGRYLTREQIERRGASNLADLVRGMRGVRSDCQAGRCFIQMARAQRGCSPEYYVDGNLVRSFGPETPVHDMQGLEVYTGSSDVPAEFSGSNAACGVIVIWTKSSP